MGLESITPKTPAMLRKVTAARGQLRGTAPQVRRLRHLDSVFEALAGVGKDDLYVGLLPFGSRFPAYAG